MGIDAENARRHDAENKGAAFVDSIEQQAQAKSKRHNGQRGPEIIIKRDPLDWVELAERTPPPRRWFIDHWLGPGPMLLAGRGGMGKSILAQQFATALALGRDFIDAIERPIRVLTWMCEDDADEIWRRQLDICKLFDVELGVELVNLVIVPRIGLDNTLYGIAGGQFMRTSIFETLSEQVNDYRIDHVILDNTGHVFGGVENDKHHVTTFINATAGLFRDRVGGLTLIGHPSKSQGSEFSGNAAWENAVRMRWFLSDRLPDEKQDEEPRSTDRVLSKRKTNYSDKDTRRLTYSDGVLAPEACGGVVDSLRRNGARRCVLTAVAFLNDRQVWTSHSTSSRDKYLPKRIGEYKLGEGYGSRELADAMADCISDGSLLVEQEVGRNNQRKAVLGLKVGIGA